MSGLYTFAESFVQSKRLEAIAEEVREKIINGMPEREAVEWGANEALRQIEFNRLCAPITLRIKDKLNAIAGGGTVELTGPERNLILHLLNLDNYEGFFAAYAARYHTNLVIAEKVVTNTTIPMEKRSALALAFLGIRYKRGRPVSDRELPYLTMYNKCIEAGRSVFDAATAAREAVGLQAVREPETDKKLKRRYRKKVGKRLK